MHGEMHLDFVVLFKYAIPLSRYFMIHLRDVIITVYLWYIFR